MTVESQVEAPHNLSPDPSPLIPRTMRAVVLTGPHQHEVRDDVPVPHPGPLEVLSKVDSVAICCTDPHIYQGRFPGRWPTHIQL